jgi:hypothetical protein
VAPVGRCQQKADTYAYRGLRLRLTKGEVGDGPTHMNHMRAWTASAVRKYYLDPEIVFLGAGHRDPAHALSQEGYYITPHCEPDCCQAFGGISQYEFGPFLTSDDARTWSANNMAVVN